MSTPYLGHFGFGTRGLILSISFFVLNPRSQDSDLQAIRELQAKRVICIGAEAYHWATPILDLNIDPQHDLSNAPFSATSLAAELCFNRNALVFSDELAVFIGQEDLDAYCCAAILLKTHEGSTQKNPVIGPDGRFFHRIVQVDTADQTFLSDVDFTRPSKEEYLAMIRKDPLVGMHSYVRCSAPVSEKVRGVLQWLTSGIEPVGCRESGISTHMAAFDSSVLVNLESEIALVESTHIGAMRFGYHFGKYAIVYNIEFTANGKFKPHLKYTIGRRSREFPWDANRIFEALDRLEAMRRQEAVVCKRWGGSTEVGGSEQGYASVISPQDVLNVVKLHLR